MREKPGKVLYAKRIITQILTQTPLTSLLSHFCAVMNLDHYKYSVPNVKTLRICVPYPQLPTMHCAELNSSELLDSLYELKVKNSDFSWCSSRRRSMCKTKCPSVQVHLVTQSLSVSLWWIALFSWNSVPCRKRGGGDATGKERVKFCTSQQKVVRSNPTTAWTGFCTLFRLVWALNLKLFHPLTFSRMSSEETFTFCCTICLDCF